MRHLLTPIYSWAPVLALASLLGTSIPAFAAGQSLHYHLEVLPAFDNPTSFQRSEAIAINDSSEVTGLSSYKKSNHAFIFSQSKMNRLISETSSVNFSLPRAINSAGFVAGSASTKAKQSFGFLASLSGGVQLLQPLAGDAESSATALNDKNELVGLSRRPEQTTAVFTDQATNFVFQPLAFPQDSKTCRARAITAKSLIYGDCENSKRESFAVVWTAHDHAAPLAAVDQAESSRVYAAVDGIIAGSAVVNGLSTAILWTSEGEAKNLGVFGTDDASEALSVNNSGLAVGYSSDQTTDAFRAVAFSSGEVIDLNTAVDSLSDFSQLTFANGVNNKGEIVGIGNFKAGGIRGYILTPIYSK